MADSAVLVFGCGYLGRRVAERWRTAGRVVQTVTRGRGAELAAAGFEPIVADVTDPTSLDAANLNANTVLYAVGMDRSAGKTMREVYVQGLENVLRRVRCKRFLYVSSTGVYGQTDGEWVNEDSATEPLEESGKIVLEAERLLRAERPDATVLRFAGLYGPGRILRRAALLAGEPLVGDAEKYLNLIDADDGAAAVERAEHAPPGVYCIADGSPVRRREFYSYSAEVLAAPPAQFVQRPEPGLPNRRVDASRARNVLGWQPRHATYREGLRAAVS
jgi:nucleoside-diphosphate-sugar epimerase